MISMYLLAGTDMGITLGQKIVGLVTIITIVLIVWFWPSKKSLQSQKGEEKDQEIDLGPLEEDSPVFILDGDDVEPQENIIPMPGNDIDIVYPEEIVYSGEIQKIIKFDKSTKED